MARGGVRPGSGRPKGAATKRTREIAEQAIASGLTPLEFMLNTLRDEDKDFLTRFGAAKHAAPYIHPKLSSVEATGKNGGPIETVTTIELVAGEPDEQGSD